MNTKMSTHGIRCSTVILILIDILQLVTCEVKIKTSKGTVSGIQSTWNNRKINEFKGIPYAEPPVGDLRFKRPQALVKFKSDPIEATEWSASCQTTVATQSYQSLVNGKHSEDCLYLNIWSPNVDPDDDGDLDDDESESRPVMFFIHGNSMSHAQSNYDGMVLSSYADVVVVTINYRVGYLGFLYTGDDKNADARGNMGLWDVFMALKFVHEVIEDFGGDQDEITIFGDSSSGTEVSLITMSPLTQKYFKKAIISSSTGLNYHWVTDRMTAKNTAIKTAGAIGCDALSNTRTVEPVIEALFGSCFEDLSDVQMLQTQVIINNDNRAHNDPTPIFGDELIPKEPKIQIKSYPKDKDILSVAIDFNGGQVLLDLDIFKADPDAREFKRSENSSIWREGFQEFIYSELKIDDEDDIKKLMHEYFTKSTFEKYDRKKWLSKLAEFHGDASYYCPSVIQSDLMSEKNDVYFFLYNFFSDDVDQEAKGSCSRYKRNSCSFNDYKMILGYPLMFSDQYSQSDQVASYHVIKSFGDFVKYHKDQKIPPFKFNSKTHVYELNPIEGEGEILTEHKKRR